MSDIDVIIQVHTDGIKKVGDLSASLRNLTNTLRGISVPMSKLDTQSRAVNKALGITSRGVNDHAKSVKNLVQNQKVLLQEQRQVSRELGLLKNAYVLAGRETTQLGRNIAVTTRELQGFSRTLKSLRLRAFGSDIQNISLRLSKMGKDAQFVGRSLLINLTLPLATFARIGLQSFRAVDQEMTRLIKVSENLASSLDIAYQKMGVLGTATAEQQARAEKMVGAFDQLNYRLTTLSLNFGVAKEMVTSIAADFAELGITSEDNTEKLTTMTLQIEKLGNMDIGPAQDLTTALYFQSRRALEVNGALGKLTTARAREAAAISAAKAQMLLFNSVENATALTLRDLGEAFPEVASAATSFGLSMTEAAAMLAPMKAAGLDVGASANSIKVSLQRLLAPTKQNTEMLNRLAEKYGVASDAQNEFTLSTKTGLIGLDATVKIFRRVRESSAGMEGALRLMSDLFEKRQGPRMYLAIEQLADFNKELEKTEGYAGKTITAITSAEIQMAKAADTAAEKFNSIITPKTIRSFKDIGNVARIATAEVGQKIQIEPGKEVEITGADIAQAKAMRKAVSDLILEKRKAQGIDLISEVKTETGRAMMIQLAGAANAQAIAQQELDRSLETTGVAIDQIKIAFKEFAASIIAKLKPAIESLSKRVVDFLKKWSSPEMKEARERIINMVISIGSLLASMGPLILAIGTFQSVVGNAGKGLSIIFPKLKNVQGEFIGIGRSAQLAGRSINNFYQNFLSKAKGTSLLPSPGTGSGVSRPANPFNRQKVIDSVTKDELKKTGATPAEIARARRELAAGTSGRLTPQGTLVRGTRGRNLSTGASAALKVLEASGAGPDGLNPTSAMATDPTFRRVFKRTRRTIDRARDISKMSPFLEAAGVSTDEMGTKFVRRGREITEGQARGLGRGGVAGVRARTGIAFDQAKGAIKSIPSAPINAYKNAMDAARASQGALIAQQAAFGATPGRFRLMASGVMGFVKSLKIARIASLAFRAALLFTGVGAIIAGIAAVVYLVIKNMDKIKGAKKAWESLKQAFNIIKEALMEIVRPIQDLFASFAGGTDEADAAGNGIAKAFEGIAVAVKFVAGVFKSLVVNVIQPYLYGIVNIVMAVVALFKGNWQEALGFLIAAFGSVIKGIINLFIGMAKAVVSIIVVVINGILNIFSKIPGMGGMIKKVQGAVTSFGNFVKGVYDVVGNKIGGFIDKGVALGIKKSANTMVSKGKPKFQEAGTEIGEAGNESITNALGNEENVEDAASKLANAIKDGVEDAAQKLYDYVVDRMGDAIKKFVTNTVKALQKQKDSALKVFDIQINTLAKLEKAEESLTKKKDYETNRRKLIDDATLRGEAYRRNRALAIYEGRIDDARILDLEEKQASGESEQEISNLDDGRRKELAKENLDALRQAIDDAKELAGKFFDESIEKFQDAAEHITRIAPVTIEQYTAQLEELKVLTASTADANNIEFGKTFEKFTSTIHEKMPNVVDDFGNALGAFSEPLDKLVSLAASKYGLGSEDEATVLGVTRKMADSVIGVTLGMLTSIGDKFEESADPVVVKFVNFKDDVVGNFTTLLEETKTAFLTPYKKALDEADPTSVFENAIIDGNTEILNSFKKLLKENPDLMAKISASLDPAILKYISLKAAADAAKEAMDNAGGGGGGGDSKGSLPYGFTTADTYERKLIAQGLLVPLARPTGLPSPKRMPKPTGYKEGGPIPRGAVFQTTPSGVSGFLNAPEQQGIPAILHGGEFVINADAVKRLGLGALTKLNDPRIPKFKKGGLVGTADQAARRALTATPRTMGVTADRLERENKARQEISPAVQKKLVNAIGVRSTKRLIENSQENFVAERTFLNKYSDSLKAQKEIKNLESDAIGRKTLGFIKENINQTKLINDMKGDVAGRKQINRLLTPPPPPPVDSTPLTNLMKGVGNNVMGGFRFAKGAITGDKELRDRGASQYLSGMKATLNPVNLVAGLLFELPKEILMGLGRTLSGKNMIWGKNSVANTTGKVIGALIGNNPMPTKEEFLLSGIGLVEDVMNIASIFTLGGTALAQPLASSSLKSMVKAGVAQQGAGFLDSMVIATGDDVLRQSINKTLSLGTSGQLDKNIAMEIAENRLYSYYLKNPSANMTGAFLEGMYRISNPRIRQGALNLWAKTTGKEVPRAALPNMLTAQKVFEAFDPNAAAGAIARQADILRSAGGGQAAMGAADSTARTIVGGILPKIDALALPVGSEIIESAIGATSLSPLIDVPLALGAGDTTGRFLPASLFKERLYNPRTVRTGTRTVTGYTHIDEPKTRSSGNWVRGFIEDITAYENISQKGFLLEGQYFDALPGLVGNTPVGFGFNIGSPNIVKKAFPELPLDTTLIQAQPFEILDTALGLPHMGGGIGLRDMLNSFEGARLKPGVITDRFSPSQVNEKAYGFVYDYAHAQGAPNSIKYMLSMRKEWLEKLEKDILFYKENPHFGTKTVDDLWNDFTSYSSVFEGVSLESFNSFVDRVPSFGKNLTEQQIDYIALNAANGNAEAKQMFDQLSNFGKDVRKLKVDSYIRKMKTQHNFDERLNLGNTLVVREEHSEFPMFKIQQDGSMNLFSRSSLTHDPNTRRAVDRHTIHSALNHVVHSGPVGGRPNILGANFIVTRLEDLLEYNPGSLNTLLGFDTNFVAPPFGSIRLPKDKYNLFQEGWEVFQSYPGSRDPYLDMIMQSIYRRKKGLESLPSWQRHQQYAADQMDYARRAAAEYRQQIEDRVLLESFHQSHIVGNPMTLDVGDELLPSMRMPGMHGNLKGSKLQAYYDYIGGLNGSPDSSRLLNNLETYLYNEQAKTIKNIQEGMYGQYLYNYDDVKKVYESHLPSGVNSEGMSVYEMIRLVHPEIGQEQGNITSTITRNLLGEKMFGGIDRGGLGFPSVEAWSQEISESSQLAFTRIGLSLPDPVLPTFHPNMYAAIGEELPRDSFESTGVHSISSLAEVGRNQILRNYASDSVWIQEFLGYFPGKFTRLKTLDQKPWEEILQAQQLPTISAEQIAFNELMRQTQLERIMLPKKSSVPKKIELPPLDPQTGRASLFPMQGPFGMNIFKSPIDDGTSVPYLPPVMKTFSEQMEVFRALHSLARTKGTQLMPYQQQLVQEYASAFNKVLNLRTLSLSGDKVAFEAYRTKIEKLYGDFGSAAHPVKPDSTIPIMQRLEAMGWLGGSVLFDDVLNNPEIQQMVDVLMKDMNDVISAGSVVYPENVETYRGISLMSPTNNPRQYLDHLYRRGNILPGQYASTSINEEVAKSFSSGPMMESNPYSSTANTLPILEHITIPKGSEIFAPSYYGLGLQNEREIIIPPTYRLRIEDVLEPDAGGEGYFKVLATAVKAAKVPTRGPRISDADLGSGPYVPPGFTPEDLRTPLGRMQARLATTSRPMPPQLPRQFEGPVYNLVKSMQDNLSRAEPSPFPRTDDLVNLGNRNALPLVGQLPESAQADLIKQLNIGLYKEVISSRARRAVGTSVDRAREFGLSPLDYQSEISATAVRDKEVLEKILTGDIDSLDIGYIRDYIISLIGREYYPLDSTSYHSTTGYLESILSGKTRSELTGDAVPLYDMSIDQLKEQASLILHDNAIRTMVSHVRRETGRTVATLPTASIIDTYGLDAARLSYDAVSGSPAFVPVRKTGTIHGSVTELINLFSIFGKDYSGVSDLYRIKASYQDAFGEKEIQLPYHFAETTSPSIAMSQIKQHEAVYNALVNTISLAVRDYPTLFGDIPTRNIDFIPTVLESRELWKAVQQASKDIYSSGEGVLTDDFLRGLPKITTSKNKAADVVHFMEETIRNSSVFNVGEFYGYPSPRSYTDSRGMEILFEILKKRARPVDIRNPSGHVPVSSPSLLRLFDYPSLARVRPVAKYFGSGMAPFEGATGTMNPQYEQGNPIALFKAILEGHDPLPNQNSIQYLENLRHLHDIASNFRKTKQLPKSLEESDFEIEATFFDVLKVFDEVDQALAAEGLNPKNFLSAKATDMRDLLPLMELYKPFLASKNVVGSSSSSVSAFAQRFAARRGMPTFPEASNDFSLYAQAIQESGSLVDYFSRHGGNLYDVATPNDLLLAKAISRVMEELAENMGAAIPMLSKEMPVKLFGGGKAGRDFETVDELLASLGAYDPRIFHLLNLYKSHPSMKDLTIRGYKTGGFVNGAMSTAIPAVLHGGEYVLNAKAVQQLGLPYLNAMNQISQSRFSAPRSQANSTVAPVTNNVSTVNIQVENFVGQEEWFNSMMKEYNINVLPKNQKLAGLEQRRFSSYNGINQGM